VNPLSAVFTAFGGLALAVGPALIAPAGAETVSPRPGASAPIRLAQITPKPIEPEEEGSGDTTEGEGDGGSGSDTFRFRVCNKSRIKASVALSALYAPGSKDYIVAGWWTVDVGKCVDIGSYPKGHFYHFAKAFAANNTSFWGTKDLQLCVEVPGPFKRINLAGYKCDAKLLKPFRHVEVVKDTYEWTLNN
jgi:uncharacterized membrane protein